MISNAPWLIPLFPAIAFGVTLFFGRSLPKRGADLGVASLSVSLMLSVWLAVEWIGRGGVAQEQRYEWFTIGDNVVNASTLVDGLSVVMLVLVSLISLLVQIYSTSYMHHDKRYTHYFAIMTLFSAAMLWFVMSANTLQMVFGWEVMSLCSFLLIGHWWEQKRNVHAAMKAFLTTRASDIGLFVGVAALFYGAGSTFDLLQINQAALGDRISEGVLVVAASALLIAAIGKSAQFPLHTWLPDAMAGPTPMSALIHAATMVVAGVFLIARLFPVFGNAFSIAGIDENSTAANPIAIIGALTVIIAAALAFVQTDIKKLLSYSTVSQLGFMVLALGVGAWVAAIFHLVTHAFSKSLLFLSAGSVSHSVHGFDMEKDMGGLRRAMPWTHASFAIGTASLIGILPLAGFWSKEQIVAQAGANGYGFFAIVALVGTFLTAAYMLRCYVMVFLGSFRGSGRPHESPLAFTVPCGILAVACVFVGFLHAPLVGLDPFARWITPSYLEVAESEATALVPMLIELGLVALAIGLGVLALAYNVGPRSLAGRFTSARALYHVLYNRLYLDWLYDKVFVNGIKAGLAWLVQWVDHNLVDNFVDWTGKASVGAGRFIDGTFDRRIVDAAVNESAGAAGRTGGLLSGVANGKVQRYLTLMVAGVVGIAIIVLMAP